MKRGLLFLLGTCVALAAGVAYAQIPAFRFVTPISNIASNGICEIRWGGNAPGAVDSGSLTSITWYYSTHKDLSDLHRLVSRCGYRDDFTDFRRNWDATGDFGYDWRLKKEHGRRYLAGTALASPLLSVAELHPVPPRDDKEFRDFRDSVTSVLLRPSAASRKGPFGIQLRVHAESSDSGFELRIEDGKLHLYEDGTPVTKVSNPGPVECPVELLPQNWYWLEAGLRTKRGVVEYRFQIFDEKRQKRIASLCGEVKPVHRTLFGPGTVGLFGAADFAELYVDPWASRWDDNQVPIEWDTTGVPDGDYYLVAELVSDRSPGSKPRLVQSSYQVRVRNSYQSASSN